MGYEFEIRTMPAQRTLTGRATTTEDKLSETLMSILPRVAKHIESHGLTIDMPPFTRYHAFAPDKVELEAGLFVLDPVEGEGDIQPGELPGGEVAVTTHVGPYDKLGEAYGALDAWIDEQGLTRAGGPWEVYLNDPEENPSSQWITEIYQPLA